MILQEFEQDDDSGNWKRRKVAKDDDEDEEEAEADGIVISGSSIPFKLIEVIIATVPFAQ